MKKKNYMLMRLLTLLLTVIFPILLFAERATVDLNKDWKFTRVDKPEFAKAETSELNWEDVNIPHDWSFVEGITQKGSQGQGGGYHNGGIGWYRKSFLMQPEWKNKTVYIDFDGIYMNSEVWINGQYLGKRPYGYISFRYEISGFLKAGKNILAVRVDNSKEPSTRWYHPCGIYAPARLIVVNPIHVIPNGIFITTPSITSSLGKVNVEVKFRNNGSEKPISTIEAAVLSPDGKEIAKNEITAKSSQNEINAATMQLDVAQPKLWSPETPVRYTLITRIISNKKTIDEVRTVFGFRTVDWKTETGFWLNGQNIKLKGVCEHWEGGPVGGAYTKPMLRWKLNLLKSIGINAIRTAHNPYPTMFYDLCDEIGLLVMDEIFDGWRKKAPEDYGKQAFDEWWKRDMEEWITRDRNHPSIFVYSLGNETGSSIAHEFVAFCQSLDSSRSVTSGAANPNDMPIVGLNGGSETKSFLSSAKYTKPFVSTEAPHTWQTRGYYRTQTWLRNGMSKNIYELPSLTEKEIFFYDWADPKTWNDKRNHFNSSYDNATVRISARKSFEITRDTPWYSGNFRWTGFDYYGEALLVHGGWPFNLFMGGTIDVAGFEKDLFYFYQSQWTKKPMVHILPHWTHPRMIKGTIIPVWAYSNADEVELFLNGRSLGKDKPGTVWNEMQCEWMVPYEEGKLEAIAYIKGKEVARATIQTASEPFKLKNTVQKLDAESGFNSNYIISTDGVDANGILNPYTENKVYYHLDGDIRLVSLENGDPVDSTNRAKGEYRKMFMGKTRAFLQSTENAKKAKATIGGILGDKKLFGSKRISICADQIQLFGTAEKNKLSITYTTNGADPAISGTAYQKPFEIADGTTVKAIVKENGIRVLFMSETFGEKEGLFWGNEKSEDVWKGRGISLQAEDAKFIGATVDKIGKRFMGEGFVTFNNNEGSVKWYQENDGPEGSFDLIFRYAHGDKNSQRPMTLIVNDKTVEVIKFESAGAWNADWKSVVAKVWLQSGANYIELKSMGESAPNIDEMIIE